jgi:lysophospholipid acyltransferase (LPLAT)-like uncharacterized protein
MANDSKSGATQTTSASNDLFEARMPALSRWQTVQIRLIAWAVYWALRLIGPTLRTEIVGVHNAIQIRDSGGPGIAAFWHRCIFPAVWFWRYRGIAVLNTVNFDGQWTRRVIERLGFGTVQGSSTHGAVGGLTGMAKQLEEGRHVAFTIDGPRGPRYVAKPGPVILARRTGRPISVFHMGLKWAYTFKKSWDLFQLPFPFSRTVMFVAPPIHIPTGANGEMLKQKHAEMQAALERVRDLAESWFHLDEPERDRWREKWSAKGSRLESAEPTPMGEPPVRS